MTAHVKARGFCWQQTVRLVGALRLCRMVPYCYKFVADQSLNADDARAYCRSAGPSADLVSAETWDEWVCTPDFITLHAHLYNIQTVRMFMIGRWKTFVTSESFALSNRTEWFISLRSRLDEGRYQWLDRKPTGAPPNSTFVALMCTGLSRTLASLMRSEAAALLAARGAVGSLRSSSSYSVRSWWRTSARTNSAPPSDSSFARLLEVCAWIAIMAPTNSSAANLLLLSLSFLMCERSYKTEHAICCILPPIDVEHSIFLINNNN